MKYLIYTLFNAGLASILLTTGCQLQNTETRTLYVDQAAVAKALGRDDLIQQQLGSVINGLNAQLRDRNLQLTEKIKQEKDMLGDKPSETQLESFRTLADKTSQQIQQNQLAATKQAELYRQQLLLAFRDELKTAAMNIARTRRAPAVKLVGSSDLWFSPDIDITDEVIAELRAHDESTVKPLNSPAPQDNMEINDEVRKEMKNLENLVDEVDKQEK